MLCDWCDMQVLLYTGLHRLGLFWTAQLLRNVFLRGHDGTHLCQREPDVLLQLCGDDWEPVAFHHEIGESFCVCLAVSYEIGGGNALRFSFCDGLAVALAPSHGLRSEGGLVHRRQ